MEDHQGHAEFVPRRHEVENKERGKGRLGKGQDDPPEELKVRCPVNPRGLVQLKGNCPQKPVENEDLVGNTKGDIRQDHAQMAVQQAQAERNAEEGCEGNLNGNNRAEHQHGENRLRTWYLEPGQGKGRHGRHQKTKGHLDQRNDCAVLDAVQKLAVLQGIWVVLPGELRGRTEGGRREDRSLRLERREDHEHERHNPNHGDKKHHKPQYGCNRPEAALVMLDSRGAHDISSWRWVHRTYGTTISRVIANRTIAIAFPTPKLWLLNDCM